LTPAADDHVPDVLGDDVRILVVGGERVPVGHKEKAVELVLQPDPVLEHAVIVPEMQASRGTHAGENP
jgi:hypothetical protein